MCFPLHDISINKHATIQPVEIEFYPNGKKNPSSVIIPLIIAYKHYGRQQLSFDSRTSDAYLPRRAMISMF